MKKNKSKDSKKGGSAKASSKSATKREVVANPRLVAALQSMEEAATAYKSSLVTIGTIIQEEQLTRAEVVVSLMVARGIEKSSAESQFTRMKNIFKNAEVLEDLKAGRITLKTARDKTTKKQAQPNEEQKKKNVAKRFETSLKGLVESAKDGGMDKASVLVAVKSACKKAGIV